MNIDTSTIEGYAEMSAEDKVKALEAFTFDDNADEMAKLKDALNKATHEAAESKKALKSAQDAQKKDKGSDSELIAALQQKVDELTRASNQSALKASYLAIGYGEDLADEKASAWLDGDLEKMLDCEKRFLDEHDKAYKAELMKGTPRPDKVGTGTPVNMTPEKFKKLSFQERARFANEHPDEYKKLYGG